jgi:cytochrome c biogenesis protein CcmG, thiol:disulfide interchange protein DsbE
MMVKKILMLMAVLPVLALLAYGLTLDPRAISSPLVGREAPPVSLKLFDGNGFALHEHSGKVVVINVWSSWCMPACYNEAPVLEAVWQRYRSQGVVFLGVNYQDRETAAREFLTRFRYTFPNGPDVGSRVAIAYGVRGVPETFFIDRNGRIANRHVGEISLPLLVQQIEQLLHASGGRS